MVNWRACQKTSKAKTFFFLLENVHLFCAHCSAWPSPDNTTSTPTDNESDKSDNLPVIIAVVVVAQFLIIILIIVIVVIVRRRMKSKDNDLYSVPVGRPIPRGEPENTPPPPSSQPEISAPPLEPPMEEISLQNAPATPDNNTMASNPVGIEEEGREELVADETFQF